MITFAAIATQLLLIVFPGLVLHRALAVRVLTLYQAASSEGEIREIDLIAYGLLPGLAIAATIGALLAHLGLFRTDVFTALMLAAVVWRRRDAAAIVAELANQVRAIWQSLTRGNLLVLVAIAIFLQTTFGLLIDAQLPSGNVDIWAHNFPLAQSLVSHKGYALPQIPNMFYGTYPLFFHTLFAEGLLFVDHVIAAKVINTIVYVSFLISLLFCARHARALAAVALLFLVINNPFFSNGASDAMTDVPRVSFSTLALAFSYLYLRDGRVYFLFAAGLLAGGAVAGKYTELLTPMLIGAALLPQLIARNREGWIGAVLFSVAFLAVACHPYLRNWILLGNPIYPFIFGHPGLTDEYMQGLRAEVFHTPDPAFRDYTRNFLSLQGWRDLFRATHEMYLGRASFSYHALALTGLALLFRGSCVIYLVLWTLVLSIFWYTVGYINLRWGLSTYMLILASGFLSLAWLLDRTVVLLEPWGRRWPSLWAGPPATTSPPRGGVLAASPGRLLPTGALRAWLSPNNIVRVGLACLALYIYFATTAAVRDKGVAGILPGWMNKPQAMAVISKDGLDAYLVRTREGFQLYRFIGDHDLRTVLQPYDNGAALYQNAYNGGRDGKWILPHYLLPNQPAEFDNFLRSNNIKYFIRRPPMRPDEIERMGPEHVRKANALIDYLQPRSRRVLTDPLGWELHAIDGAPIPKT